MGRFLPQVYLARESILMNDENPVVAFARDFSGDDAAIMTQVKS
jgi:hypothetical protein